MTKNTLLNIAIILCKVFRIVLVLVLLGLTVFFIHLQIDSNYYKGKELKFSAQEVSYSSKWKLDNSMEDKEIFTIDNIKTTSLYFNYLKFIAVFILVFMAITEFQKIMKSVKGIETFGKANVKSFRRLGKYILVYALLISYWSISFNQGGYTSFGFSIGPLTLALISFIMAEVFKEGSLLKQENDLTV